MTSADDPDLDLDPDLDALARADTVETGETFRRLSDRRLAGEALDAPLLARWPPATPAGRVLLAMLMEPEQGHHALLTLALDGSPVADRVRPMLANDETLGAAPAPRPDGAEGVLARRFAAAFAALCARAGATPGEVAAAAGVEVPALPGPDVTAALEAVLRERTVFAPGLLDLATRRAVEVTAAGGPAPGDLDALCQEMQRVLDAATRADVAAGPPPRGWWGLRGVALGGDPRIGALPDGVTYEPRVPHTSFGEYRCGEHGDYALCPAG